jgi:hypothetical protein
MQLCALLKSPLQCLMVTGNSFRWPSQVAIFAAESEICDDTRLGFLILHFMVQHCIMPEETKSLRLLLSLHCVWFGPKRTTLTQATTVVIIRILISHTTYRKMHFPALLSLAVNTKVVYENQRRQFPAELQL